MTTAFLWFSSVDPFSTCFLIIFAICWWIPWKIELASFTITLSCVCTTDIPALISSEIACWRPTCPPTPETSSTMLAFSVRILPSGMSRSCRTGRNSSASILFSSLRASTTCTICWVFRSSVPCTGSASCMWTSPILSSASSGSLDSLIHLSCSQAASSLLC